MPYFIDGNNLIGSARGVARPSEEDRDALVSELCERLRRTGAKVVLFFDGPAGRESSLGSLSIRHGGGLSADEAILREIGRSRAAGEIAVVTADRGRARAARDAGARAVAPEEFWARFGASRISTEPDPKVDVGDWIEYFGDERNRGT